MRGPTVAADFKKMVIDYIEKRYGAGGAGGAAASSEHNPILSVSNQDACHYSDEQRNQRDAAKRCRYVNDMINEREVLEQVSFCAKCQKGASG